jgi:hypothetical protein
VGRGVRRSGHLHIPGWNNCFVRLVGTNVGVALRLYVNGLVQFIRSFVKKIVGCSADCAMPSASSLMEHWLNEGAAVVMQQACRLVSGGLKDVSMIETRVVQGS